MSNFRADLHCHSLFSDGSDHPEKLILDAIASGLSGLSITDHDTVEAYKEALTFAASLQFPLLTGVEFSASHRGESIHILGYGFLPLDRHITALCQKHVTRRLDRNLRILANLKRLGVVITRDELENVQIPSVDDAQKLKRTIGRPHIALLLVEKGIVPNVKEAFQKYLGEGKPAFDPGERISVENTIAAIHAAKGFAIIAHPHLIEKTSILRELLRMPFDGIEAYYAKMGPEKEAKYIKMAQERKWLITGGSDYHGLIKPHNPLGCSWVNDTTFYHFYNHYLSLSV